MSERTIKTGSRRPVFIRGIVWTIAYTRTRRPPGPGDGQGGRVSQLEPKQTGTGLGGPGVGTGCVSLYTLKQEPMYVD